MHAVPLVSVPLGRLLVFSLTRPHIQGVPQSHDAICPLTPQGPRRGRLVSPHSDVIQPPPKHTPPGLAQGEWGPLLLNRKPETLPALAHLLDIGANTPELAQLVPLRPAAPRGHLPRTPGHGVCWARRQDLWADE